MIKPSYLFALTITLSCSMLWRVEAHAQDTTQTSSVSKSTAISPREAFAKTLLEVAQQEKVIFIAEGRPTTQFSVPTQNVTPPTDDPVLNKVNVVADAFGYSVERRDKVFLLRKRYNTPTDLPDISIAECVSSLQSIDSVLAPLNPKIEIPPSGVDSLSYMFLRHATLAQVNSMAKDGLPVTELSQEAQQAVQAVTQHLYVSLLYKQVHVAYKMLEAIGNNPVHLVLKEEAGKAVFGFETRTYMGQRLYSITSKGVEGRSNVVSSAKGGEPVFVSLEVDKEGLSTKYSDQRASTNIVSEPDAPPAPTLRQITRDLTSSTTICDVDETLDTKTATLIGTDKLPAGDLMQQIAFLYGLRLRHRDDGSLYLTRRAVPTVRGLADVTPAVRAAVPDVLLQAVRGRSSNPASYSEGMQAIRDEAIRQLRMTVEPKLLKLVNRRIVLTDLTREEQRLFAIAVSVPRCVRVAEFSQAPVPPFANGLDNIILAGGIGKDEEGKPTFSFFLTIRDPKSGKLLTGPGFFTPNYKLPEQ